MQQGAYLCLYYTLVILLLYYGTVPGPGYPALVGSVCMHFHPFRKVWVVGTWQLVQMATRTEALTRQIAAHAQSKQLDAARAAFARFEAEGLPPNRYAYAAIINANVTSGDLAGATDMVRCMERAGIAPNVVVFTSLLKGLCTAGDLSAARELLQSMAKATPPIRPDARTLNTFMRGCVRTGDLAAARWAFGMVDEWRLSPSVSSIVAFGRLLSQGLQLGELRRRLQEHSKRAAAPVVHRPTRTANPCSFWERGRCDRGTSCHFYHDPSIKQADSRQVEAAHRDAELELEVQLAQSAALLGRGAACKHALARAETLQCAADDAQAADASAKYAGAGGRGGDSRASAGEGGDEGGDELRYGTGLHAGFRRAELRREASRIRAYLQSLPKSSAATRRLDQYLCRCLVFGTRIEPTDPATAGGFASGNDSAGSEPLASRLFVALQRTAGLGQACRLGLASERVVRKQIDKSVTRKGRLRWRRIFRPLKSLAESDGDGDLCGASAGDSLPVKLEIASGTGDWVVAQALADAGHASWAAIELRHDRVYNTLSRMALQNVPNLCVLGGDASVIVREHLRRGSVSHAFINFPEPPSGYQGIESASNSGHLLTASFFADVHRALVPEGRLTIFSDNGRYCRALCATLGALRATGGGDGSALLFESEELRRKEEPSSGVGGRRPPSYETVSGVRLYHGVPGTECGHLQAEQSYFDRLWDYRQGDETERFYMAMRRAPS